MSRSLKKGPYCSTSLIAKVSTAKAQAGKEESPRVKTWSRSSTILPEFVGVTFEVHDGKRFMEVFATEDMVGHKLGEFSFSRKFKGHGGKLGRAKK